MSVRGSGRRRMRRCGHLSSFACLPAWLPPSHLQVVRVAPVVGAAAVAHPLHVNLVELAAVPHHVGGLQSGQARRR